MSRVAAPDHPVHELIANRWSPYAFDDKPVSKDDLLSLLEAARWAASSYNEQPWSFLVATKDEPEEFEQLLSCLVEPNQTWARNAPVLLLTVVNLNFSRNGKPNGAAVHDIGLAAGNLSLEATARGLSVHQMIGILPEVAREVFNIPDGHEAKTALAVGLAGDPASLPENMQGRDTAPRQRKPLAEFVFAGQWGKTAKVVR